eukprot:1119816-Prymnesium_polylepis.1
MKSSPRLSLRSRGLTARADGPREPVDRPPRLGADGLDVSLPRLKLRSSSLERSPLAVAGR